MASQSPAVVQNENLPIHRGKSIGGPKANAAKSLKKGLQERKALRDLSNANKPPAFGAPKAYTLKDKSALPKSTVHDSGITKTIPKKSALTNEQIKRCDAWAKEGIEQAHFTGNDLQELQKDQEDERVRKEVEMVLSALREWTNEAYDLGMPVKKDVDDTEDVMKLELLPEEVLPMTRFCSNLGVGETEDLLGPLDEPFVFIDNFPYLKLNDYDDDM